MDETIKAIREYLEELVRQDRLDKADDEATGSCVHAVAVALDDAYQDGLKAGEADLARVLLNKLGPI